MTDSEGRRRADPHLSAATAPGIEREIDRTRRRLGLTLDALSERFAPRRLLQKGLDMASRFLARENRAWAANSGGFRPEPIGLGLIAAGIAWIVVDIVGRRRRPQADEATAGESAGPPNGEINEDTGATAAEPSGEDGGRWADFAESPPLLIGLIGLGAGLAVAALLPSGRGEQRLVAAAREDIWQQAEALGHRTAARLRDLGRRPTAAAAERPPPE